MTGHDLFDGERDDDRLLTLVGEYLWGAYPALLEGDERLMNWLMRDIRRRPPRSTDWNADRVRRVRRRVIERALSERFGVVRGGRQPAMREVPGVGFANALEEASRVRCAPWTSLAAAAGEGRELWDEECDRWVELPANVPGGRYVALGVAGDSMVPLLHPGDTILVRLDQEIRRDTIVVARRTQDVYVVKQVGRLQRRHVELLSLNRDYEPIMIARNSRAIVGTVVMRWCAHDALDMARIPQN